MHNLPERFNNLVQLSVSETDGLSLYYRKKCLGKMHTIERLTEEMKSLASSSYSKAGHESLPSSSFTGSPTTREKSRKRIKDTSGNEASPHTTQARPVAKRALGTHGRRLVYSSVGKL